MEPLMPETIAQENTAPVWQSMAVPRPSRIEFADLEQAGMVTRMGEGAYAASGLLTQLFSQLDNRVRAIAVAEFGAVEHCYPALIPTVALQRAGYFDSFPQLLMTAGRFHSDAAGYQGFAHDRTEHTGYCLSPTVCYHAYHQFAGKRLAADGSVLTACGKIFRFESDNARTLERLWDFTMREVIFLGDRNAVTEVRRNLVKAVCRMIDDLRLAGQVEVANDPFFGNGSSAKQVMVQRALKMKYELHLPVVDGRTVAVGSFNLHGSKFGEAFDISLPDGSPAYSGCIGIGLERIAYAFLCRHGIDPSDWPAI
jgi:seryl-tRNA synthetase